MSAEMASTPSVPASSGVGPRLCSVWTRCYTRRLSPEVREDRRAEIASDVWEQVRDASESNEGSFHLNASIVGRVLSGIPADLSWRRETLRSQRAAATGGTAMSPRVPTFADRAVIVLAAIGASIAATLLPLLGSAGQIGDAGALDLLWFFGACALGAALVAGLVVRDSRPRVSTTLLIVGALAPSVAWFWLPPVWLISVGIVVTAVMSARERARPVASEA